MISRILRFGWNKIPFHTFLFHFFIGTFIEILGWILQILNKLFPGYTLFIHFLLSCCPISKLIISNEIQWNHPLQNENLILIENNVSLIHQYKEKELNLQHEILNLKKKLKQLKSIMTLMSHYNHKDRLKLAKDGHLFEIDKQQWILKSKKNEQMTSHLHLKLKELQTSLMNSNESMTTLTKEMETKCDSLQKEYHQKEIILKKRIKELEIMVMELNSIMMILSLGIEKQESLIDHQAETILRQDMEIRDRMAIARGKELKLKGRIYEIESHLKDTNTLLEFMAQGIVKDEKLQQSQKEIIKKLKSEYDHRCLELKKVKSDLMRSQHELQYSKSVTNQLKKDVREITKKLVYSGKEHFTFFFFTSLYSYSYNIISFFSFLSVSIPQFV